MGDLEDRSVNTAPAGDPSVDVGTAEDVEAVMKKYDRESNTRIWTGVPELVIRIMLALFSLFMVWMNLFASFDNRVRHCLFLGFIILFVFILYPAKKGTQKVNHIPWYDIVLAVVGAACYFNYVINLKSIVAMMTRIGTTEVVLGIIGILILAECCRRVVGIPILRGHGLRSLCLSAHVCRKDGAEHCVQPVLHHQRRHWHPHQRVLHLHRAVHHLRRFPGGHRHRQLLH